MASFFIQLRLDGAFKVFNRSESAPNLTEPTAVRAPAMGGVEREQSRIKWLERTTARWAVHFRAEDGGNTLRIFYAGGAFADFQGLANEVVGCFGVRFSEFADERIDRVFLKAFEFLESLDSHEFAIDEKHRYALASCCAGDVGVIAFAGFNEIRKESDLTRSGFFRDLGGNRCRGATFYGDIAIWAILNTQFGKEES